MIRTKTKSLTRPSIIPRASYSKSNADGFRKIFDGMTNQKDRFIPLAASTIKISTLYLRVTDALRWLANEEGGWYRKLKDGVRFKCLPDGVLITFTASKKEFTAQEVEWKDEEEEES